MIFFWKIKKTKEKKTKTLFLENALNDKRMLKDHKTKDLIRSEDFFLK